MSHHIEGHCCCPRCCPTACCGCGEGFAAYTFPIEGLSDGSCQCEGLNGTHAVAEPCACFPNPNAEPPPPGRVITCSSMVSGYEWLWRGCCAIEGRQVGSISCPNVIYVWDGLDCGEAGTGTESLETCEACIEDCTPGNHPPCGEPITMVKCYENLEITPGTDCCNGSFPSEITLEPVQPAGGGVGMCCTLSVGIVTTPPTSCDSTTLQLPRDPIAYRWASNLADPSSFLVTGTGVLTAEVECVGFNPSRLVARLFCDGVLFWERTTVAATLVCRQGPFAPAPGFGIDEAVWNPAPPTVLPVCCPETATGTPSLDTNFSLFAAC